MGQMLPRLREQDCGKQNSQGRSNTKVEVLEDRPLQCYCCLEGGYVAARCPNQEDRSNKCYRCGQEKHYAQKCTNEVHCPVCAEGKRPSKHKMGAKACPTAKRKREAIKSATTPAQESPTSLQERERAPPPPHPRSSQLHEGRLGRQLGAPREGWRVMGTLMTLKESLHGQRSKGK